MYNDRLMTAVLEPLLETRTGSEPAAESVILYDIDWAFYEALQVQLHDRRLFVTFDDGVMEIMSPSFKHDRRSRYLGLLVTLLAEELAIPISGIRSTTLRRKDLQKALEADEAFYVTNYRSLLGVDSLNLDELPPPDLVIEVEISRRLGLRRGIYAAMGVPELWRCDEKRLVVETLQPDRCYSASDQSLSFPALPIALVVELIEQGPRLDDLSWISLARQWVRDHVIQK